MNLVGDQPVNPPDKPGWKVITLPTDDDAAAEELDLAYQAGFTFVAFDGNRVLLKKGYKNG